MFQKNLTSSKAEGHQDIHAWLFLGRATRRSGDPYFTSTGIRDVINWKKAFVSFINRLIFMDGIALAISWYANIMVEFLQDTPHFPLEFSHANAEAPPMGFVPLGLGVGRGVVVVSFASRASGLPRAMPFALSPDGDRRAGGRGAASNDKFDTSLLLPSSKNRDCPPLLLPIGDDGRGDAVFRETVRAGLRTLMPWSRFGRATDTLPLRWPHSEDAGGCVVVVDDGSRRQLPHTAEDDADLDVADVGMLPSVGGSRGSVNRCGSNGVVSCFSSSCTFGFTYASVVCTSFGCSSFCTSSMVC